MKFFIPSLLVCTLSLTSCYGSHCDGYFGDGYYDDSWDCRATHQRLLQSVPKKVEGKPLHIRREVSSARSSRGSSNRIPNISGVWNVELQSTGGSCPGQPALLPGAVSIRQVGRRALVRVANYGSFLGKVDRRGLNLRGMFTPLDTPCMADFRVRQTIGSSNVSIVRTNATIECLGDFRCTARAEGSMIRVR
jgi:hypothetical protein